MSNFFYIAEVEEPCRLDTYLAEQEQVSRSQLKNNIKNLLVNGQVAKLSQKIKGGERIEGAREIPSYDYIEAQNIPLDVIYENACVTVVNKPQGMVTHPGAGNHDNTLVNALLYRWNLSCCNEHTQLQDTRPGLVHRLDKDTSGVLIAASTIEAQTFLQNQFKERRVKKHYLALVRGRPPVIKAAIKTQIVRSSKNRKLFAATDDPQKGKFAHTIYETIGYFGPYSLLRLRLKTGRTHQLRVHLKHIHCPIVGDSLYGHSDDTLPNATLMLHARLLGITLPDENAMHFFKAPLPLHFKQMLSFLQTKYPFQKCKKN